LHKTHHDATPRIEQIAISGRVRRVSLTGRSFHFCSLDVPRAPGANIARPRNCLMPLCRGHDPRRDGRANRHAKREHGRRDDQLGRVAEYRFVFVGYGRFERHAFRFGSSALIHHCITPTQRNVNIECGGAAAQGKPGEPGVKSKGKSSPQTLLQRLISLVAQ
jgi:hypothetical protein